MPDPDEVKPQEAEASPAEPIQSENSEHVEEEVEAQEPPANLTQRGLDEINEWRRKHDEEVNGLRARVLTLTEEREQERAEHRRTIEGKETHDGVQKQSETNAGGPGEGAPSSSKRSKPIRLFRGSRHKSGAA